MNFLIYLSTLIGLALLCSCANSLVDYSISFAQRFKLSRVFIGVVIIGFGSSLPEVFSVATATKEGLPELAVSTVIGSNIANIGLLLGLSLLITKQWPNMTKNRLDFLFIGTSYFLLLLLIFTTKTIQTWQGCAMVSLLIIFVILTMKLKTDSKEKTRSDNDFEAHISEKHSITEQIFGMLTGLAGITIGAQLLIEGATTIAQDFGIPEKIIGITMMALGTSLPETAASIAAARKNEAKLVLGNVIGSNMFNILAALGISASIQAIPLKGFEFDGLVMLGMGVLLLPFFIFKKGNTKPYGIVLLIAYTLYITYAVMFRGLV